MVKLVPISLSLAALALLAACGSRQPAPIVVMPSAPVVTSQPPATSTAPAVVQSVALRPGMGRIESIAPASTASTGGTTPSTMQRLNIRMDGGSMQVVDTPSADVAVGDRIELTREGFIRRHPQ